MPDRVEVTMPAWCNVSFGVHRLTAAELTELRAIPDVQAFTERLLTLSVHTMRERIKLWGDDWARYTCNPPRIPPLSSYTAAELEPLLTAALAINELVLPAEGTASAMSSTTSNSKER